jgi:hypothetical protein
MSDTYDIYVKSEYVRKVMWQRISVEISESYSSKYENYSYIKKIKGQNNK